MDTVRVFRSVHGNMKGLKEHYSVRGLEAFCDFRVLQTMQRARRTILGLLRTCHDKSLLHEQIALQSSQASREALERGRQDARDAQEEEEEDVQPSDVEESDSDTESRSEEAPDTKSSLDVTHHTTDAALKQLHIVNMKMLQNIKEQRRLSEIASDLDLALEQVDQELPSWNAFARRLGRRDALSHAPRRPARPSSLFGLHLQGMRQRTQPVPPVSWTQLKAGLPLKHNPLPAATTTSLEQIVADHRSTGPPQSGSF